MCFLEFFLINGIIFSTDFIKKHDNYNKIYHQLEKILENIMEESNNYLKFNFFYLAFAIVSSAREIFELKKLPLPLKKIFGFEYNNFEKEYNSLFIKDNEYNDTNTNTENKKEIIIKGNNNTILLNFQDKDNNSNKKLTKSNTSNFNLYQKNSNELNNKYCNNIINLNINNYSIDNNINSYLYKRGINLRNKFKSYNTNKE